MQIYLCQFGGPFAVLPVPRSEKGTYRKVTIPLDAFRHAGGRELNGLMFKGGGEVDLYIDDITLDPCNPVEADAVRPPSVQLMLPPSGENCAVPLLPSLFTSSDLNGNELL
jgi:hypothetical protein